MKGQITMSNIEKRMSIAHSQIQPINLRIEFTDQSPQVSI